MRNRIWFYVRAVIIFIGWIPASIGTAILDLVHWIDNKVGYK